MPTRPPQTCLVLPPPPAMPTCDGSAAYFHPCCPLQTRCPCCWMRCRSPPRAQPSECHCCCVLISHCRYPAKGPLALSCTFAMPIAECVRWLAVHRYDPAAPLLTIARSAEWQGPTGRSKYGERSLVRRLSSWLAVLLGNLTALVKLVVRLQSAGRVFICAATSSSMCVQTRWRLLWTPQRVGRRPRAAASMVSSQDATLDVRGS